MRQEIKIEWLDRLLSGFYKQSTGTIKLKIDNQFFHCVMGVLFEMAVEAGIFKEEEIIIKPGYSTYRLYLNPEATQDFYSWSGLDDKYPKINGVRIASLNDKTHNFKQLAELIDKYL